MGKKHKVHLHDIPDAERRDAVKNFDSIPMSRRKIRAYFDADIPVSVAERVRAKLRWDVLSAQEQADLRNRDDEFHYGHASMSLSPLSRAFRRGILITSRCARLN